MEVAHALYALAGAWIGTNLATIIMGLCAAAGREGDWVG